MSDAVELIIQNGDKVYVPIVEEGIEWSTERKGVPGKLSFKILDDGHINVQDGNAVRFRYHNKNIFYGFIFQKKTDKSKELSITCYDQLRYLKNKETYVYSGKTANELIKTIADDFHLQTGKLCDTKYRIANRIEEDKALIDMIQNALDITLQSTKKIFVLYDDFGKITLNNIEDMRLNLLIDEDTSEDYEYSSSIDSDTYNQIKLVYDNDKTGKREVYLTRDSNNINQWGLLQYYEKIDEKTNGKAKADALLSLYNKKTKSLRINNVLGDTRVRAGSSVIVSLTLNDIKLANYLIVEKVKHIFKENEHFMDLDLKGGVFNG